MIIFQKLNQFNKGISLSSPLIKLFSIKKSPSSEINESLDKLKDKKLEPPQYIHSKNYNFEQFNKGYASKVITAMDQYIKKQEDDKTLNIPRRRRKILANPKYDLDLTNYSVWRIYDQLLCKLNNKSFPITCKLLVLPADLRRVFFF